MLRSSKAGLLVAVGAMLSGLLTTACNDYPYMSFAPGQRPIAVIESAATSVSPLDTLTFSGLASYDPDAPESRNITEYRWSIVGRPEGSTIGLEAIGNGGETELFVDLAGSYQIQLIVVNTRGQESEPAVYGFDAIPWQDIHVQITWDVDLSDVDLHVINATDGGEFFRAPYDCFYSNMNPDWGNPGSHGNPSLDIDDVNGFGPENINVAEPEDNTNYEVTAHYYSDDGVGGTNATVRIYLNGTIAYEDVTYLQNTGKIWTVANVTWPQGDITPIGTVAGSGSSMVIAK